MVGKSSLLSRIRFSRNGRKGSWLTVTPDELVYYRNLALILNLTLEIGRA